jgi:cytochrome c2
VTEDAIMRVAKSLIGTGLLFGGLAFGGIAAAEELVGDAARGAVVFKAQCSTCHSVTAGVPSPIGPHLAGVVGRPSASYPGYKYSSAMKNAGVTWTPERLHEYLESPWHVAPGTPMSLVVPSFRNRADVIAYLMTTKAPPAEAAPAVPPAEPAAH